MRNRIIRNSGGERRELENRELKGKEKQKREESRMSVE